jgi:cell division protein FtsW (lipid II flippase)
VGGEDLRRLPVTERPQAPWHPFPLVELCVLAGIVLLVLGLLSYETDRGKAMLVSGMLLGSLGGLDTALREHFSGYRSHAMILAALPAVGLAGILFFAGAPWPLVSAVPVVAFAAGLPLLLRAYRRAETRGGTNFGR